ncbi:MAG TPA: T9SS type A sorting domain-containing protein [Flavobacteriales bacterium]|nr:T9SS type A sorting domain-containing protein [Flavobacteriales bacterium]
MSSNSYCQNLVPNPGFEDTIACPTNYSEITNANGWMSFGESPDYFNSCSSGIVGIPTNFAGNQPALGNAYAGLYTYDVGGSDYREYIGTQLSFPLVIGTRYYLSLLINRGDNLTCSSNNIGFRFFTDVFYSTSNPIPTDNFSHFHSSSIVTDSVNWIKIAGSFIADSTYQYVVVGNFYNGSSTSSSNCSTIDGAYYYVDAICVSQDSLTCYVLSEIEIQEHGQMVTLYPNPVSDILNVKNVKKFSQYAILNSIGEIVKSGVLNGEQIDVSAYANGIYFLLLERKNSFKFFVNH